MNALSQGKGPDCSTGSIDNRLSELEAENERLRAALAEHGGLIDHALGGSPLEPQIRLVADALPVLISYVDADQRYRYNNKAYEDWYGCSRSQLFGMHLRDALGEDDYAKVRPLAEAALAGERVSADASMPDRQGKLRYIHVEFVPDRRADGKVLGYYALIQDVSESKRAEHVLRESEARFRAVADCTPAPVWMTGRKGVEFVNKTYFEAAGRSVEELAGGRWKEMVHPDDLPNLIRRRNKAWRDKKPYGYDARFIGAAGEWRWLQVACNPRLDDSGNLVGYVGMAVDVTEQKRAEAVLRESEARFRSIADSAPAPIWMTNEQGMEFANRSLCEFTGLTDEQLRGESWIKLAHPDDLALILERRARAWETRTPYDYEARFRRHDGEWRWLRASCKPRESTGEFLGYVGLAVDVTDSRRAEQVLRDSEALLRAIFDNAGVGMVLMDGQGAIVRANAAFCSIVGRDLDELIATSCLQFTHPEDIAPHLEAVAAMGQDATAQAFEKRYEGKDARIIWVRITLSTVADQILAVVEDVTARKQAEAALRDLNQSLEHRVAAAIAEREQAEEALRQAQKMEAVGQLTGGIAHDFNNLLTVIGGNLDLAARRIGSAGDPRILRSIGNAMTGAQRAATLTQRLLAFSRRQPLAPKAIDTNLLLAGMTELLHRTLGETIEVETRLTAGLSRIEADPHQLESAILNLAVNARDAMPQGGKLVIETANVRVGGRETGAVDEISPGKYVVISVSDTGTGMNRDTLRRAVEPFFTTKEVGKGTGLGLSMVYGFVRQSGGHLRIESDEGQGSRIHIYLPQQTTESSEEEKAEAAAPPRGAGEETILVCEDDEDVRAYTVELLGELGYRVIEAQDGPSAMRLLDVRGTRVDMLFTDVVLPGGMSGAALAEQARAARPGLKVLFTTGYARDAIVHEGRLDPGIELVPKPFDYAELARRVRDMLDRR